MTRVSATTVNNNNERRKKTAERISGAGGADRKAAAASTPTDIAARSEQYPERNQEDEVDSLLHSAIDIDQSIVLESAMVYSPSSTIRSGVALDPRVEQQLKKIEGKALKSGEILHEARRKHRQERADKEPTI